MAQEIENQQARRFRPGDMARVVVAREAKLLNQIVILERWRPELERWSVYLTGGPTDGVSLQSGRPMNSSRAVFRESSLAWLPARDTSLIKASVAGHVVAEAAAIADGAQQGTHGIKNVAPHA